MGANALIYLSRGDMLNAAISGAAIIIPGAAGMRMMFRNADEAAAALARLTRASEDGVVSLRRTSDGGIDLPILNQPPYCFIAGTLVATSAGLTAIECIQPSDQVWAFNSRSDEWELCEVQGISCRAYDGELVTIDLALDDGGYEQIVCTGNHPFWVESGESLDERPAVQELPADEVALRPTGRWSDAKWLRLGDRFLTRTGESATVAGLTIRTEQVPVYNLKVSRLHNYAVGQCGVAVHNNNVCPGPIQLGSDGSLRARLIHEVMELPVGSTLTGAQQAALRSNVDALIDNSLPNVTTDRFLQLLRADNRFKFLGQIPEHRERLRRALQQRGVDLPEGL